MIIIVMMDNGMEGRLEIDEKMLDRAYDPIGLVVAPPLNKMVTELVTRRDEKAPPMNHGVTGEEDAQPNV